MSTSQRRNRAGTRPNSRIPPKRTRTVGTSTPMAAEAEPIELEENADEVVDLTCESTSDGAVVDLTHNDSVVYVEEDSLTRRSLRNQPRSDSCVLSSDDEDSRGEAGLPDGLAVLFSTSADGSASSRTSGTVSCPICMDTYSEIVQSGRLIVATKCGHIFCSQCLRDSLKNSSTCPTCRKKLTHKQYHPIYI